MIALPANTRIWIAAGVTDLRRGFIGFSAQVRSGHVFAYRGRRGDMVKLLWADHAAGPGHVGACGVEGADLVAAVGTALAPQRDRASSATDRQAAEDAVRAQVGEGRAPDCRPVPSTADSPAPGCWPMS